MLERDSLGPLVQDHLEENQRVDNGPEGWSVQTCNSQCRGACAAVNKASKVRDATPARLMSLSRDTLPDVVLVRHFMCR